MTYKQYVVLSDEHGGSPVGLMCNDEYKFLGADIRIRETQKIIRNQYYAVAEKARELMKGRHAKKSQMTIIKLGELIEGANHHGNREQVSGLNSEHREIAFNNGIEFMRWAGFNEKRGDELYVCEATESHSGVNQEHDNDVARRLGAVPRTGLEGRYVWDKVKLQHNGKKFHFEHHAPAGPGRTPHTKANGLTNKMKHIVQDLINNNEPENIADYYTFGHYHEYTPTAFYANYPRYGVQKVVHAMIAPCFKGIDIYTKRLLWEPRPTIGGVIYEVFENGLVKVHPEYITIDPPGFAG